MKVFDYIYYRIYSFYENLSDTAPWVFALAAIIISQYCFLICLENLLLYVIDVPRFTKGITGNVLIIGIVLWNSLRYLWLKPYSTIQMSWREETIREKRFRAIIVLSYLLGSLFFALAFTGFFNESVT
jgi:hypothetical protein